MTQGKRAARKRWGTLERWLLAALVLALVGVFLTGCASQVREVCGTLPDGSEFCTLIRSAG